MEPNQILNVASERLTVFKKTISESNTDEIKLEIRLGDSFLYFFKVYDNFKNLKSFKENEDFLNGIQQIWNAFKHNQKIILIEHHKPFILDNSLLDGKDFLGGSTKWMENIAGSGRNQKGKLSKAFSSKVCPMPVLDTIDMLIKITNDAIFELNN